MNDRTRVLALSYLPPVTGGIATWAGILRGAPADTGVLFDFEEIPAADWSRTIALWQTAAFFLRLSRRLAFDPSDVVHLNCCLSPRGLWRDLAAALLVRAARWPLVTEYHGSIPDVLARLPRAARAALEALIRLSTVNACVTRASETAVRRIDPSATTVILPNFVEDDLARRPRAGAKGSRRVRVIYTGRLSGDKGTPELLEVARALPQIDFELVGEVLPEMRPGLERLPANVTLPGLLPRARVLEKLLECDVFILPSHREGFPIAVLEAMAAGLPVVATRVGALPDMIEDDRGGVLVSPGDVNALVEAVRRIAEDPDLRLRMGTHNRDVCASRFGAGAVVRRMAALYESLRPAAPTRASRRPAAGLPSSQPGGSEP